MPASTARAKRHTLTVALCLCASGLFASEPEKPAETRPAATGVTFETDVQPLLTRLGCNSGACHGKSRGQNGFALSLLGFDSDFDYAALVGEGRGRRIFPAASISSLILRKGSGQVPHGGGKRFDVGGPHYEIIRNWIECGAQRTPEDAPQLVRVVAEPASRSLTPKESFQLRVIAEYSDGGRRDVTDFTAYQSNDRAIANPVDGTDGVIQAGPVPVEAAIMARYMNHIAVCAVTIPLPGIVPDEAYQKLPRYNDIDS